MFPEYSIGVRVQLFESDAIVMNGQLSFQEYQKVLVFHHGLKAVVCLGLFDAQGTTTP